MKLNSKGVSKANSLIGSGKIKHSTSWSGLSANEGNSYIEKNGVAAYGAWFLGVDSSQTKGTKGYYAYPFTDDFQTVNYRGLTAIRQRAGQQGATDIFNAAGRLIERINKKEGKNTKAHFIEERKEAVAKLQEFTAKLKESKAQDQQAPACTVDQLISIAEYLNEKINRVYSELDEHYEGHLPACNSREQLIRAVEALGLDSEYDIQPKVMYAKDGKKDTIEISLFNEKS